MALLRLASVETDRLFLDEDKTEWIDVRSEISKKERNALIKKMPTRADVEETGLTPAEGVEFQTDLFEVLVLGWSADFPCTTDSYLGLPPEASDAIDVKLAEHFAKMVPTKDESGKQ